MRFDRPFVVEQRDPSRAYFYWVKSGEAWFCAEGSAVVRVVAGEAVGVEGHRHRWSDASNVHPSERSGAATSGLAGELFVSSIDRSTAVLQGLPQGSILIPADAHPFSNIIAQSVSMIELVLETVEEQSSVTRRLAEIIMLQIVAYARQELFRLRPETGALQHDEFLLRAMTAFLSNIETNWTLQRLADTAGLSRSAFAARFRKAYGEPPIAMLNRLRLLRSAEILPETSASLATIAEQIGFGSPAAFARAFRRQFGKTPGAFRRSESADARVAAFEGKHATK